MNAEEVTPLPSALPSAAPSALPSAFPSSMTMVADTPPVAPSSVYMWKLAEGWEQPLSFPEHIPVAIGFDATVTAKSDTHPDVIADLVAEFMTDTVLRIDSDAAVDINVVVKEDLIIVTGQVGCSHPAKAAIVHSEQFLSTVNSSIRELLRDIGFGATAVPPSTLQASPAPSTTGEKSPKKMPSNSSANVGVPEETNDALDPTNVHVIIAITPSEEAGSERVSVRAKAAKGMSDLNKLATSLVIKIASSLGKAALTGGVVVHLSVQEFAVTRICVGVDSALTDQMLRGIAADALNLEFLTGLSPSVSGGTVVELRQTERARATGTSSKFAGKDWTRPERHGHVIARQAALNLVSTGACEMCEVELTYSPSYQRGADAFLAAVLVNAFGSSKESTENLAKMVIERIAQRSVREVKESILKDANSTLFSLEHGGSVCNHEFISEI